MILIMMMMMTKDPPPPTLSPKASMPPPKLSMNFDTNEWPISRLKRGIYISADARSLVCGGSIHIIASYSL